MLENVDNRKEILRNKVLVTSVPVNTTQVIFRELTKSTSKKRENGYHNWFKLAIVIPTLVRLNSRHSIFEHIPSAKVSKRR